MYVEPRQAFGQRYGIHPGEKKKVHRNPNSLKADFGGTHHLTKYTRNVGAYFIWFSRYEALSFFGKLMYFSSIESKKKTVLFLLVYF